MADFQKALTVLEFDKILQRLADCAQTDGAKQMALSLHPMTDAARIRHLQAQTADARRLAEQKGAPSFSRICDVRHSIDQAEKGATLSPHDLLAVANVLSTARRLKDYGEADRTFATCIDVLFERLFVLRSLEETIKRALPSEDTVADEASAALAEIRRKKRHANTRIKETLQQYTGGQRSRYLQENIVTVRNGRYVIPVKAEYKNEIKGLIHDTSSSGATVFVEPMAVVEANNELCELERKEQREIERILADLSAQCAAAGQEISLNYLNLTELAFVFAKAELALRMKGCQPILNDNHVIALHRARHPLLDPKTVVPIDVTLGQDYDTLVVTGPNTGGKTVTLKTLGLFCAMAQSGLQIAADEPSTLCVLDGILADIGDEQSIEQSLSTFSAHMKNIVRILEQMTEDSLVLFDELGAGTDPVEGAALAVAVLEQVKSVGALCAATTHYAELKMYALDTERVCNASCEFDLSSLRPTYRLIVGTPGKSNAFAISQRLGLPEEIVSRADSMVSQENKRFEAIIGKLEQDRIEMEKALQEAKALQAQMQKERDDLEAALEKQLADTQKELEKSRVQAQQMLASAKMASESVFAQIDALQKQRESERLAQELEESRRAVRKTLREVDLDVDVNLDREAKDYVLPRPVRVGDTVILKNIQKEGTVTAVNGKKITVQTGNLTTQTKEENLMLAADCPKHSKPAAKKSRYSGSQKERTHSTIRHASSYELDLRGEYGEDAWVLTDRYLDQAVLSNLQSVRLIHGKGTGALRKALWAHLKDDPRVKSYRIGAYGEGDLGVTVVELK